TRWPSIAPHRNRVASSARRCQGANGTVGALPPPVTSFSPAKAVAAQHEPRVRSVLATIWRHAGASDVNGLAAEIGMLSFLAFVPFFVVMVTLGGVVGERANLQNPADQ